MLQSPSCQGKSTGMQLRAMKMWELPACYDPQLDAQSQTHLHNVADSNRPNPFLNLHPLPFPSMILYYHYLCCNDCVFFLFCFNNCSVYCFVVFILFCCNGCVFCWSVVLLRCGTLLCVAVTAAATRTVLRTRTVPGTWP